MQMEITIGSLFTDKKGNMFTVYEINKYQYLGAYKFKVIYFPISDNGLINKTAEHTCKLTDIGSKFKLLDWKF